jgi:hypothetical protein
MNNCNPSNFIKVMKDFLADLHRTFPEYKDILDKMTDYSILFEFCKKKYPPMFFDILYENNTIFQEPNIELLPGIDFHIVWNKNISEKTKEIIWKYLQLILFSVVGNLENKDVFGDTAKIFEAIPQEEFYKKLEETMAEMNKVFEGMQTPEESTSMPNPEDINNHISSMLDGKIGQLAKEIAAEASEAWNTDSQSTDMKDVFSNLIKNPKKIMNLVKTVSTKLEEKIKSGELKESELMEEAKELMSKMKNMPGMGDLSSMLGKMGFGGAGRGKGKVNVSAMENMLNRNIKSAKLKEKLKERQKTRVFEEMQKKAQENLPNVSSVPQLSEEELIKLFPLQKTTHKKNKRMGAKKTTN